MTDLPKDHKASVKGFYAIRLDQNSVHIVYGLFSYLIDKAILLLLGVEGELGYILDGHFVCTCKILHKTKSFLKKPDTKAIVSFNKQFVRFVESIYIKLLCKGRGDQYVDYSLINRILALKIANVLCGT